MIAELAGLAAGAIVFGVGTLFGVIVRSVLPRRSVYAAQPELICSCEHGYGTHNPETGECLDEVGRDEKYVSNVGVRPSEWVRCRCVRYDGPLPIETYVSRGMVLPPAEGDR